MTDVIITVFQIYSNIDPLFLSFLPLIPYLSRSLSSWSVFLSAVRTTFSCTCNYFLQ